MLDLVHFRRQVLRKNSLFRPRGVSPRSMARRGELLVYAFMLFVAACGSGLFLNGFFPDAPLSSSQDGPGGSSVADPDLRQAPKVEHRTTAGEPRLAGTPSFLNIKWQRLWPHIQKWERKFLLSEYTSLGRRG